MYYRSFQIHLETSEHESTSCLSCHRPEEACDGVAAVRTRPYMSGIWSHVLDDELNSVVHAWVLLVRPTSDDKVMSLTWLGIEPAR